MNLHELSPAPGSTHRRKVVGRGPGSGHGKNATRGHKGQKKHGQVNPNFEGGQTPLHRRLPQARGFKPINRIEYAVVNVGAFSELEEGTVVDAEMLHEAGVLRHVDERIKVLGDGDLTVKLTVKAHKFSKSAVEKIQAAGGVVETV